MELTVTGICRQLMTCIIQVAAGCLLAIPSARFAGLMKKHIKTNLLNDAMLIVFFSACGILLPLGPFGLLPVFAAFIVAGAGFYLVLPMLASNSFFSVQALFTENVLPLVFYKRQMIFALLAGICIGMAAKFSGFLKFDPVRSWNIAKISCIETMARPFGKNIAGSYSVLWPYLAAGVIANGFFQRYAFREIMVAIYTFPVTSGAAMLFMEKNAAVNSVFKCIVDIAAMSMNLASMSALLSVLRIRTVIAYYLVYTVLAGILAAVFLMLH